MCRDTTESEPNKGDSAAAEKKVQRGKDHALRRNPLYSKGQARFENILDVAAELLDEVGAPGLTTNLIARSAGINVATLYQYFPNKQAILLALLRRHVESRMSMARRVLTGLHKNPAWRDQMRVFIAEMLRRRASMPGLRALRMAMRSSPDLVAENHEASALVAGVLSAELQKAAAIDPEDARVAALCVIEALIALLDVRKFEVVTDETAVVRYAEELVFGFLARYLDPGAEGKPLRSSTA